MAGARTGDRIGLYAVDAEIGTDPTGVTYRGVHLVLPRRALIKVMHAPSPDHGADLAVHVLREACILEALQHPGIVRVYESGLLDGRPWFARELVEGESLATLIARGSIDDVNAITLLRDIAEVIDHAARRGIIHCGLRPERVVRMGRTRGFPLCITEWGEARAHDAARTVPAPAPSPYAAPELASGDPVDDRADVFSLGVIAYQILTGALPLGEGVSIASDGSMQHVPTEVRCPELPRELTGLVDQMLAYDRWDRPSAREVFAELTWLAEAFEPAPAREPNLVRIRQPRWTPQVPHAAQPFAGLLDDDAPRADADER